MKSGFGFSSLQIHLGLCDVAVWLLCGLDRWGRHPLSGGSEAASGVHPPSAAVKVGHTTLVEAPTATASGGREKEAQRHCAHNR